ncbi:MAG: asparagine synthetase A [Candidatus Bathyarchaeota archaeon]|nr:asparagine synthetase A [Candidatus Bathyarchaeota archaeon]MDH5495593.1 asparagine synthetase A [Candidatus Bathyarchaeota archaeon]
MESQDLSSLESVRLRYRAIRRPEMKLVLKVQDQILTSIREFLRRKRFMEILAPIIGPATDPGIRGAKQVSIQYYGAPFKIMSSMILYKQMIISSFEKVFALSPNIRLELPESVKTARHLAEFRQIDLEMVHASYDDAMNLAEGLLASVVRDVREKCYEELKGLGRDLKEVTAPFKRLTHKQAVQLLRSNGYMISFVEEIPWDAEVVLSALHERPFFVYDYPLVSRGFYDREDSSRPGILRDFDMLYPEGFGEAISGGEREHTYEGVLKRMKLTGVDPEEYEWYLQMLKEGIPHSVGFGIGIERLTRWICGLKTIWEAVPFPKVPGIASP